MSRINFLILGAGACMSLGKFVTLYRRILFLGPPVMSCPSRICQAQLRNLCDIVNVSPLYFTKPKECCRSLLFVNCPFFFCYCWQRLLLWRHILFLSIFPLLHTDSLQTSLVAIASLLLSLFFMI